MPYIKFANLHNFICLTDTNHAYLEINNLKQSIVSVYRNRCQYFTQLYITYRDDMKHGLCVSDADQNMYTFNVSIYYRNVIHGRSISFNKYKDEKAQLGIITIYNYGQKIKSVEYSWHSGTTITPYKNNQIHGREYHMYKSGYGYDDYSNGKRHGISCFCVYYRGIEHMQFTRFFKGIMHGNMRIYRDKKLAMYAVYKLGRCLYKYYYNIDDVYERQAKIRASHDDSPLRHYDNMNYMDRKNYVNQLNDLPYVDTTLKQLVAITIYLNFVGMYMQQRKAYLIDKKYRKYLHFMRHNLYEYEDYIQNAEYFSYG